MCGMQESQKASLYMLFPLPCGSFNLRVIGRMKVLSEMHRDLLILAITIGSGRVERTECDFKSAFSHLLTM